MKQKLWTKPFVAATIANLFMPSVVFLLLSTMAGYAISAFAASDMLAGFSSSSFVVGAILGRLFSGKYLDFLGRRRVLLTTLVLYIVVSLAYLVAYDLWVLIALRVAHGAIFGAGNTALVAGVQAVIPPERRGEGNGYFLMAATISMAIGPSLAIWLSHRYTFDAVFLAAATAGGVALVASLYFDIPERELTEEDRRSVRSWSLSTFVDPGALKLGIVVGFAGFAISGVIGFIALHTELLGRPEVASTFFVTYALATMVARLFAGRLQDRRGDNVVIIPVFASFILGLLVLTLTDSTLAIIGAGVLIGIGYGTVLPALLAIVIRETPAAKVGVASSTYYLFLDIGAGVGPVFFGLIITQWGFSAMFLATALLAAAGLMYYLASHGRRAADIATAPQPSPTATVLEA